MPVFGLLLVFSHEPGRTFTEPLRAYMQALGYVEGRNIVFDVRYADGKVDRLPTLAAELVAQRPAVIATFGDATGLAGRIKRRSGLAVCSRVCKQKHGAASGQNLG